MDAVLELRCEDRPIVGRDEELAVLRETVGAVSRGQGGLVLIEGAPGSGKTCLVREAAVAARRRGLRVVWLPDRGGDESPVIEAALQDAAGGRPVVVIDDRDGRTVPSGAFGEACWRLPVLLVMTGIEGGPGSAADLERHATRLRLRPLPADAIGSLAARTGIELPDAVLDRLQVATGGNALLVVETLAMLDGAAVGDEDEPWPLSERAVTWTRARLDALSADSRDAVEVASVLGEDCDVGLVGKLMHRTTDPPRARAALAASAFTTGAGGRGRFVPPLGRELVYATLSAGRRERLHARAAAALAACGMASRAALAHRSLAAAAAGDARRCEHYLLRLAEERSADATVSPSVWPYFVREAEHWAIGFGDRAIRLNDRIGLLYLARLLSRPGVELAAETLGERARRRSAVETQERTISAERARVRVTRRIRDGIERIARAHPELGAHLQRTIRTGARCAYVVDPATGPRWEVRLTL